MRAKLLLLIIVVCILLISVVRKSRVTEGFVNLVPIRPRACSALQSTDDPDSERLKEYTSIEAPDHVGVRPTCYYVKMSNDDDQCLDQVGKASLMEDSYEPLRDSYGTIADICKYGKTCNWKCSREGAPQEDIDKCIGRKKYESGIDCITPPKGKEKDPKCILEGCTYCVFDKGDKSVCPKPCKYSNDDDQYIGKLIKEKSIIPLGGHCDKETKYECNTDFCKECTRNEMTCEVGDNVADTNECLGVWKKKNIKCVLPEGPCPLRNCDVSKNCHYEGDDRGCKCRLDKSETSKYSVTLIKAKSSTTCPATKEIECLDQAMCDYCKENKDEKTCVLNDGSKLCEGTWQIKGNSRCILGQNKNCKVKNCKIECNKSQVYCKQGENMEKCDGTYEPSEGENCIVPDSFNKEPCHVKNCLKSCTETQTTCEPKIGDMECNGTLKLKSGENCMIENDKCKVPNCCHYDHSSCPSSCKTPNDKTVYTYFMNLEPTKSSTTGCDANAPCTDTRNKCICDDVADLTCVPIVGDKECRGTWRVSDTKKDTCIINPDKATSCTVSGCCEYDNSSCPKVTECKKTGEGIKYQTLKPFSSPSGCIQKECDSSGRSPCPCTNQSEMTCKVNIDELFCRGINESKDGTCIVPDDMKTCIKPGCIPQCKIDQMICSNLDQNCNGTYEKKTKSNCTLPKNTKCEKPGCPSTCNYLSEKCPECIVHGDTIKYFQTLDTANSPAWCKTLHAPACASPPCAYCPLDDGDKESKCPKYCLTTDEQSRTFTFTKNLKTAEAVFPCPAPTQSEPCPPLLNCPICTVDQMICGADDGKWKIDPKNKEKCSLPTDLNCYCTKEQIECTPATALCEGIREIADEFKGKCIINPDSKDDCVACLCTDAQMICQTADGVCEGTREVVAGQSCKIPDEKKGDCWKERCCKYDATKCPEACKQTGDAIVYHAFIANLSSPTGCPSGSGAPACAQEECPKCTTPDQMTCNLTTGSEYCEGTYSKNDAALSCNLPDQINCDVPGCIPTCKISQMTCNRTNPQGDCSGTYSKNNESSNCALPSNINCDVQGCIPTCIENQMTCQPNTGSEYCEGTYVKKENMNCVLPENKSCNNVGKTISGDVWACIPRCKKDEMTCEWDGQRCYNYRSVYCTIFDEDSYCSSCIH